MQFCSVIRSTWASSKWEKFSHPVVTVVFIIEFLLVCLWYSAYTLQFITQINFLPFSSVVQLHPWRLTSGNAYLYQLLINPSSQSYVSVSEVRILTVQHKTVKSALVPGCVTVSQYRLSHSEIAWLLHVNYGSLYLLGCLGSGSTRTA